MSEALAGAASDKPRNNANSLETSETMPKTGAKTKRSLVLALLACAVLLLVASGQPWAHYMLTPGTAAKPDFTLTGAQILGGLIPVALCVLLASFVLMIASRVLRWILAAIVAGLGALLAVLTGTFLQNSASPALREVTKLTAVTATDPRVFTNTDIYPWAWIAMVTGAIITIIGIATLATAHTWPGAGRKYGKRGADAKAKRAPDRIDDWDALSAGTDPSTENSTETRA